MMTTPESTHRDARKALHCAFEAWLDKTCHLFPEQASRMGFKEFHSSLSENSPAIHHAHIELIENTLLTVEHLPEAAFQGDDWLDRRGFLAKLRTDLLFTRDLARWRTNPQVHCDAAAESILDLLVRSKGRLGNSLPAIESRLKKIPAFLAAGAECIKAPVPLWISLAERACAGAVEFLESVTPEFVRASAHPYKTRSLLKSAAAAFVDYSRAIQSIRPGAPDAFAIGGNRFEFLIRERLGLDLSITEARTTGDDLIALHQFLLEKEARKFGRKSARDLIAEAAEAWQPTGTLLEAYRSATATIKARLKSLDIVTLPAGEDLQVLPVPSFLRHQFPTAAYNPPQPFARRASGIFWVNDLSLTETDPVKRSAEIRQHFGLELTCAHEAYPGHHLQFSVQYQHPSRIRRICEHAIFYEGWTMWCEKMSVEMGLADFPQARLVHLHDALWRAHRIVIDCGLQDGSLTPGQAARQLSDGVGFTASRAAGDVNWYTSSPTVPMSYLLGRREVENLHSTLVLEKGWSLNHFNNWMLSHGSLPWSWIRRTRLES